MSNKRVTQPRSRDASPCRKDKSPDAYLVTFSDADGEYSRYYCKPGSLTQKELNLLLEWSEDHPGTNILCEYAGEKYWDEKARRLLPSPTKRPRDELLFNARLLSRFGMDFDILTKEESAGIKEFDCVIPGKRAPGPFSRHIEIYLDPTE